jgi:hypothetical protein
MFQKQCVIAHCLCLQKNLNSSKPPNQIFFGRPALYCTNTNSGTASQAAPHELSLWGFFVHPVAPYIFSTETIACVGRGLDPEARTASG